MFSDKKMFSNGLDIFLHSTYGSLSISIVSCYICYGLFYFPIPDKAFQSKSLNILFKSLSATVSWVPGTEK